MAQSGPGGSLFASLSQEMRHINSLLVRKLEKAVLFPGPVRGFSRKTPGKSRENCWIIFPKSRNATNSRISGTKKGKPAGNLGSIPPGPCPQFRVWGVFLKSTVPALSSFSDLGAHNGVFRVGAKILF